MSAVPCSRQDYAVSLCNFKSPVWLEQREPVGLNKEIKLTK